MSKFKGLTGSFLVSWKPQMIHESVSNYWGSYQAYYTCWDQWSQPSAEGKFAECLTRTTIQCYSLFLTDIKKTSLPASEEKSVGEKGKFCLKWDITHCTFWFLVKRRVCYRLIWSLEMWKYWTLVTFLCSNLQYKCRKYLQWLHTIQFSGQSLSTYWLIHISKERTKPIFGIRKHASL